MLFVVLVTEFPVEFMKIHIYMIDFSGFIVQHKTFSVRGFLSFPPRIHYLHKAPYFATTVYSLLPGFLAYELSIMFIKHRHRYCRAISGMHAAGTDSIRDLKPNDEMAKQTIYG
jgi:hypothetical protein